MINEMGEYLTPEVLQKAFDDIWEHKIEPEIYFLPPGITWQNLLDAFDRLMNNE